MGSNNAAAGLDKEQIFGMAEKEMEYRVDLFNRKTWHPFDSSKWGRICRFLITKGILDKNSIVEPIEASQNDLLVIMEQGFNFWNRALNPLTWIEILRLVLVAAGFSAKQSSLRRETLSKEGSRLAKYGLRPGTLKGELFNILGEQGSNGLKISDLARSFQIVELNLPDTSDELEERICSTLSSDITLFEKISPSAYRLRVNTLTSKGTGTYLSDSEDSGSVDDDSGSSCNSDSGDSDHSEPEELDSGDNCRIVKHKGRYKMKNNKLTEYTEIDESQSGEVWVLGLMEGEYSDLSIEEKLNVLVALVDLTAAGSSIRPEKQKIALAKQLNLRPRQVEVWFQNRRARTKLKQTEVDCEFLKRLCENLTEENRRLQKEVQELRALKLSPQLYMHMPPPTTLTLCPSCERVAVSSSDANHRPHHLIPISPWAPPPHAPFIRALDPHPTSRS